MSADLFAHGIGRLDLLGGTVRIELAVLGPSAEPNGTPVLTTREAVYMPLEGFIQSVGAMEEFIRKLAEAKVISLSPVQGKN